MDTARYGPVPSEWSTIRGCTLSNKGYGIPIYIYRRDLEDNSALLLGKKGRGRRNRAGTNFYGTSRTSHPPCTAGLPSNRLPMLAARCEGIYGFFWFFFFGFFGFFLKILAYYSIIGSQRRDMHLSLIIYLFYPF